MYQNSHLFDLILLYDQVHRPILTVSLSITIGLIYLFSYNIWIDLFELKLFVKQLMICSGQLLIKNQ